MSIRINKTQKIEATKKMVERTYAPQFTKIAEKYKNLLSEIVEYTFRATHSTCKDSGIDRHYFNTEQNFCVNDINDNRMFIHTPLSHKFKLPPGMHGQGRNIRETRVYITTPERMIVPAQFYGTIKLEHMGDKTKANRFEEKYKKLKAESKALAEEIDEYHRDISSILAACNTMKKLESTFPAAVKFFPTPQQAEAAKLPVPVEPINTLTEKLNTVPA